MYRVAPKELAELQKRFHKKVDCTHLLFHFFAIFRSLWHSPTIIVVHLLYMFQGQIGMLVGGIGDKKIGYFHLLGM